MKKSWNSAKCVFRLPATDSRRQIYEERIILIEAKDFDSAIKKAEKEANQYCDDSFDAEFTGFVDVFHLFDKKLGTKTEIFSTMQTSDLNSVEYLNHFYPDMPDDCESEGQTHRWHRKDNKYQSCYHCRAVIKG